MSWSEKWVVYRDEELRQAGQDLLLNHLGLDRIQASASWQITGPLRGANHRLKGD